MILLKYLEEEEPQRQDDQGAGKYDEKNGSSSFEKPLAVDINTCHRNAPSFWEVFR